MNSHTKISTDPRECELTEILIEQRERSGDGENMIDEGVEDSRHQD